MKYYRFFIIICLILFISSCRKVATSKIGIKYNVVEYTKDNINITNELIDSCGSFMSFYAADYPDFKYCMMCRYSGPWKLSLTAKKIKFELDNNLPTENYNFGPLTHNGKVTWDVERLTEKDLWLSCDYNNSDYYLKLFLLN